MFEKWKAKKKLKQEQALYVGLKPHAAARYLFKDRRTEGVTVKELREILEIHHGKASSILSNDHKAGKLARLTEKRNGCRVYVLPEFVDGRETEKYGSQK